MGTWSDDSSMILCTIESIIEGYAPQRLTSKFLQFMNEGRYTPDGNIFDIGIGTRAALMRAASNPKMLDTASDVDWVAPGGASISDNGNGSLMRIAPMIVLLKPLGQIQRYQLVKEVSGITHAHIRSVLACFYLCEYLLYLEEESDKFKAYRSVNASFGKLFLLEQLNLPLSELEVFEKVLSGRIHELPEEEIHSTGYVIHTLESAMYCFLTTSSYREAVLTAVNLGSDTDTVGSVTGNLAGFYYGSSSLPQEWISEVRRIEEILELAEQLEQVYEH
ncbi:ADP-ribosylglycohydrolase [Pontibacter chinhatensis]|uniref:ADP-ribosylglycohydrolase n=2 Tax=Pontibacter chinhatensis TaxID=1436961 RepID=A0A1I2ZMQ5_9BACT|nr:ADP-ribosylglycohydrolase [Pontibacter chinhatensis]